MDRSKYKRREVLTSRHISHQNLGNPTLVPKAISARPHNLRPAIAPQQYARPAMARPIAATTVTDFVSQAAPVFPTLNQANPASIPTPNPTPSPITTSTLNPNPNSVPVSLNRSPQHLPQPTTVKQPFEQAAPLPQKVVRVAAFNMDLPGEPSPSLMERFKSRKGRRLAFRGVAVALVLVITLGGLLASQTIMKANKVFNGSTGTAAALKKDVAPELLDGEGSGRVNVLMLGRGGGNHDAPDLTDSLILASIDPVNHTSILFSIPRDLWVTVPGHGVMKLNAAWEQGVFKYQGNGHTGTNDPNAVKAGFKLVDQTISEAIGIKINYNIILNFDAFKQSIDTVNGVNINVPTDLIDPTMAWENANDPVLAHAGQQAMDGKKALSYVRSRETSSDFARSQRQRAVMLALKDKITSLNTLSNPLKISGLLNAFGNNIQTDLSLNNASRLYEITKTIDDSTTTSISLADGPTPLVTTGNVNGQSVVLPKAGLFKYDAIQAYIRSQLKDPYIVRENASIMVLNGTTLPGLATAKANELKAYGYNVISTANTPTTGWTQTTLVDLTKGKDKYTRNYLEKHFGLVARDHLPDDTIATNRADFVMIIGSDEANPTKNQAR